MVCFCAKVAAFFVESGMSVAGVILPPEVTKLNLLGNCVLPDSQFMVDVQGYLRECYSYVRAVGGLCVADEVQTGFGRFGAHYWGFQQQGVVPDIVTMGKPFGNGMPLAAVVCTRELSDSFACGPECAPP